MSTTAGRVPVAARGKPGPAPAGGSAGPALLEGTELLGRSSGSGLTDPPFLIRRRDGQVVSLSALLYGIAAQMDGAPPGQIAARASDQLEVRITPEQIAHVAEQKLAPLGLVAHADGSVAEMAPRNGILALRVRAGLLPAGIVRPLAAGLRFLFLPAVILAALASLIACDVWLGNGREFGQGVQIVIRHPVLGLALFVLLILSLVVHELGHAAACRYGGAAPGRIGIGIYLVWPVFFSDVTDSWRLSRRGRLRTDLGGVYFNLLLALAGAGAYLASGYQPLLLLVVGQQLFVLDQFVPWIRLDGYHVVSDLIGVSDLFARIKPVLSSLVPGRPADPRVRELKPWARGAVAAWVMSTIAVLGAVIAVIAVNAPRYLRRGLASLLSQAHLVGTGQPVGVLAGLVGLVMLALPAVGLTFSYLMICRRAGTGLARRQARSALTLSVWGD